MKTLYDRTEQLLGREALTRLKQKRVLIFGIGGVGGAATEALARTGIGTIGLVDHDIVDITNINRQIIALHSTVGLSKVQVMKQRIRDINPQVRVEAYQTRLSQASISTFCLNKWDYLIDAIDDVPAKLLLIQEAKSQGVPIICSMGTGNKLNPTALQVADISKTHTDPLAKLIRKEVRKKGIKDLRVVFSSEKPHREVCPENCRYPASVAFVPAVAGLILASEVVKDLIK